MNVSTLPKFTVDADQASKTITMSKQGDALYVERIVLSKADRLNLTTEAVSIEIESDATPSHPYCQASGE